MIKTILSPKKWIKMGGGEGIQALIFYSKHFLHQFTPLKCAK